MNTYLVCYSNTSWHGDYRVLGAVNDSKIAQAIAKSIAENINSNTVYNEDGIVREYHDGYNWVWVDEIDMINSSFFFSDIEHDWIELAKELSASIYVGPGLI